MALFALSTLGISFTLAADDAMFLVSFWKPVVLLLPIIGWGWVVSNVYDKHAKRFFLETERWGMIHMIFGVVAFAAALAIPLANEGAFWAGLGAMILILLANLGLYAFVVNRDERVPAEHRIGLNFSAQMAARKAAKQKAKSAGSVKLIIRDSAKVLVAAPQTETPEFELRVAAEDIMIKAFDARAAQVEVIPVGKDNAYAAAFLVDGVRTAGPQFAGPLANKMMDFWKAAAKLDIADRRKQQIGDCVVEHGSTKKNVRITSIGAQGGMRLTMLFDPATAILRKAADLGLAEAQMVELKAMVLDEKRGVVLMAGQPDGGRTTSLYSILQMHDAYTQSIQTVEIEPQGNLEGIKHQAFDPFSEGADYATTVRSMLRRDPDVLGVAEMPDAATAKEAAKSDGERSRLYLSIKATDCLDAAEIYVKAVGDPAQAAKHLRGLIAHRLLRKLCGNCKVAYPASPEILKKLGAPEGKVKQLFKKGGQVLIKNKPEVCPVCQGGGYYGQEGYFEIYSLTDEDRELVAASNFAGLKASLRKRPLLTLQQAAIRKALVGLTSVEEVQRSMSGQNQAPAPAAPRPASAASAPSPAPTTK